MQHPWLTRSQVRLDALGNEARPLRWSIRNFRSWIFSCHSDVAQPRSEREAIPGSIIHRDESPPPLAVNTESASRQARRKEDSRAKKHRPQQHKRNRPRSQQSRPKVPPGARVLPRAQSTRVTAEDSTWPFAIIEEPEDSHQFDHTDTQQPWITIEPASCPRNFSRPVKSKSIKSTKEDGSGSLQGVDILDQQARRLDDEEMFPMS